MGTMIVLGIVLVIIVVYFLIKNVNGDKIFEAKSEVVKFLDGKDKDYKKNEVFVLYSNGKVVSYDIYNKAGETNKVKYRISDYDLQLFTEILQSKKYRDLQDNTWGSEGEVWEFITYEKGEVVHTFKGYIYNNELLLKMVKVLKDE